MAPEDQSIRRQPPGLVDILDKILDKGLVVAGDIKVSLANVELLTIQLRLVVCSVDKAQAIGIDWWRRDPFYSGLAAGREGERELDQLRERVTELERQLGTTRRVRGSSRTEEAKGR